MSEAISPRGHLEKIAGTYAEETAGMRKANNEYYKGLSVKEFEKNTSRRERDRRRRKRGVEQQSAQEDADVNKAEKNLLLRLRTMGRDERIKAEARRGLAEGKLRLAEETRERRAAVQQSRGAALQRSWEVRTREARERWEEGVEGRRMEREAASEAVRLAAAVKREARVHMARDISWEIVGFVFDVTDAIRTAPPPGHGGTTAGEKDGERDGGAGTGRGGSSSSSLLRSLEPVEYRHLRNGFTRGDYVQFAEVAVRGTAEPTAAQALKHAEENLRAAATLDDYLQGHNNWATKQPSQQTQEDLDDLEGEGGGGGGGLAVSESVSPLHHWMGTEALHDVINALESLAGQPPLPAPLPVPKTPIR